MSSRQELKLKNLKVFTRAQAQRMGLSNYDISMLVRKGEILRMGRGIYWHQESNVKREIDFEVACAKFGKDSVVGGLSALFYYNLIEQVPIKTWVIVPANKKTIASRYRLVRSKVSLKHGIIRKPSYRIVSIERAIVEGLKLASKIGERTAIRAAREAIRQGLSSLDDIGKMAKELHLDSYLSKYFEAIVA